MAQLLITRLNNHIKWLRSSCNFISRGFPGFFGYLPTHGHTQIYIFKNKINLIKLLEKNENCLRNLENIAISNKYSGSILTCKPSTSVVCILAS